MCGSVAHALFFVPAPWPWIYPAGLPDPTGPVVADDALALKTVLRPSHALETAPVLQTTRGAAPAPSDFTEPA